MSAQPTAGEIAGLRRRRPAAEGRLVASAARMPNLLIVTSAVAGRVNAACALAHRLQAAGHHVTLASPAPLADRAELEGLPYLQLGTRSAPAAARHPVERLRRRLATGGRRAQVAALRLDGYRDALASLATDLAIVDMELHAYAMTTAAGGTNLALFTDMLSVWKRKGLPPLHRSIVPGAGRRGSAVGMEWAWLRYRMWKWLHFRWLSVRHLGAAKPSVLRRVARELGYPLRREAAWYQWLIPFTFRSLPVLQLNALELEFPHDPLPTVDYVGPVVAAGRPSTRAVAPADRQRLDDLHEARAAGRVDALIYASFGAWHQGDRTGLLRRVVAAVGAQPGWALVIGLGGRGDRDRLGALPPNVHVFDWAPHPEMFEKADLVLHHGGIHTINECIASGAPMLAYPIAGRDTMGAAARMAYHGLGALGDDGDSAAIIGERIAGLLADQGVPARIEEFRGHLAAYEKGAAVEHAVASILDRT